MEIILLGTGTSQGVPLIGHPNDDLDLSEPKNWRNRSCAHLVCDGAHIQIDAGPEFRLAALQYGVPAVDYFFLTHGHSDHILGMDDLRRFCDLRNGEAIPVWTTAEGKERVEAIFPYALKPRSTQGYIALLPQLAHADMTLPCRTRVQTTILPHGPRFVSLGMVFTEKSSGKRLAYYTDCNDIPAEAIALARDVDVLVIDALYHAPHPTHLNIEQALAVAEKTRAKQTVFTHMTFRIDYKRDSALLPPGVCLGYDGMRICL